MQWYWFLLGSLGAWRITHLLSAEDGPWKIFNRMRTRLEGTTRGNLFSCFYCLSAWVTFPLALLIASVWRERLLTWPALSGAAILLEEMLRRMMPAAAAYYMEDEEEEINVLRK